jgi:glycosyltransferase involved in cell wall biosynthesis
MKVSVLMAAWRPWFIKEAIESYLQQNYRDSELIIMNDCPTDEVQNIVKEYRDRRISYHHKEHTGMTDTLSKATEFAIGDLVCQLDDDNMFYDEESISCRVKPFLEYDIDMVYAKARTMTRDGVCGEGEHPFHKVNTMKIWGKEYISMPTMMWRRSIHDVFDPYGKPDIEYYWDWYFKIVMLMEFSCLALNDFVIKYREHGNQAMAQCRSLGMVSDQETKLKNKLENRYGGKMPWMK